MLSRALVTCIAFATFCSITCASDPDLRQTLRDQNALGEEWWVYNNLEQARADARRENKPLFVTFRCVPCKDCAAFDAESHRAVTLSNGWPASSSSPSARWR